MEHFSHLGTSNNSRGATTPNSFMYLPSSTHRHHHEPPPPPNFQNHNNIKSSPNPNTAQQNTENVGSSQNPYARRFIDVSSDHDQNSIKAKIISHPQYSSLLLAYMDCQKVGAPPQVAERLSAITKEIEAKKAAMNCRRESSSQDPELDQFMEAYCNMLMKYREELMRPLHEAMDFLKRVESQLNSITNNGASSSIFTNDEKSEGVGSSEEDQEGSGGEGGKHLAEIDPRAEDKELKTHLLKKYRGYLSSLRHELSKKKKKGKLPKEARQKLLNWWELHYKWPYPSESEKVALAESTGLDQKQINNWFINQRKRHWKPSEDMQFVVMDAFHPQNAAALYMGGGQFMGDTSYRLGP